MHDPQLLSFLMWRFGKPTRAAPCCGHIVWWYYRGPKKRHQET